MVTLNIDDRALDLDCSVLRAVPLQMTLADSVKLSGMGLHTGSETSVTIYPAQENAGIVFSRGNCLVEGLVSNVVDTSRGTTIGCNGTHIQTVEHLMAALRGMGVDNAFVEVSGSETPALDGSALPYVEAIQAVGLAPLKAERRAVVLAEPIWIERGDSFILAVPAPQLRITYVMNYDHPMIGAQSATYVLQEKDFGEEIAPARTFVLYEEVAGLLEQHLARGGSLDNAIVIWQDRMSCELRFPDELIRHKVMDIVGDLALIGGLLHAEVLAVKSGHTMNVEFAAKIADVISEVAPKTNNSIGAGTLYA